jgi:glutathionylspermidine synthase
MEAEVKDMQRLAQQPRLGWQKAVEDLGVTWHTHDDGSLYWDESACYSFSSAEVDMLEEATNNLHQICLQAVEHVIANNRYGELGIPTMAVPLIVRSWRERAPSLYGRFDLAYDGYNPPKMLEYNADTPTSLLEAAVVQWYWLQAVRPQSDQFNSLWEAMVARWKEWQSSFLSINQTLYLSYYGPEYAEDHMTVACMMQETAKEAGIPTQCVPIKQIGWDARNMVFVDGQNMPMHTVFKLYPWEWMLSDSYAACLGQAYNSTRWIEPYWKLILSSKGILAILWELFPNHPNLVEAHFRDPQGMQDYAKKPLFSREGANITIEEGGSVVVETGGTYASDWCVYQALCPLADFNGKHPVIGSWIIADEAHGMGIRESDGLVTDNLSRFIPHYFE